MACGQGRVCVVARRFEELAWRETAMGAISLRRRRDPELDVYVYEVKLDDDFLMSSLFTVAEVELARLGLAALPGAATGLDVVVGGLGLGYTARAALQDERVRSLVVVEALEDVVGWHEAGLLPLSAELTGDPRTRLVTGDFFASVREGDPLDGDSRRTVPRRVRRHRPQPTTRPAPQSRRRSTRLMGCGSCASTSVPARSSPCGRTTRRTTSSWTRSGRSWRHHGPTW